MIRGRDDYAGVRETMLDAEHEIDLMMNSLEPVKSQLEKLDENLRKMHEDLFFMDVFCRKTHNKICELCDRLDHIETALN